MQIRQLPYLNLMQIAVTFEIDSTLYEYIRHELMLSDWFAAIGGLMSLFLAVAGVFHLFESPHYFVTSAMLAQD